MRSDLSGARASGGDGTPGIWTATADVATVIDWDAHGCEATATVTSLEGDAATVIETAMKTRNGMSRTSANRKMSFGSGFGGAEGCDDAQRLR